MFNISKEQKKEMAELKRIYFIRVALADMLQEKADEVDKIIKNTCYSQFKTRDGQPVTPDTEVFEYCDEDADTFFKLRKIAMRDAGLGHPRDEEGFSVECVAHNNVVKMEHRIFKYALSLMPEDMRKTFAENPFRMVKGKLIFDSIIDLFLQMA